jgi:hypothetical protein
MDSGADLNFDDMPLLLWSALSDESDASDTSTYTEYISTDASSSSDEYSSSEYSSDSESEYDA